MRCHLLVFAAVLTTALPRPVPAADPAVPAAIAVPAGHKELFRFDAKGVQIYKAVKADSGALEWTLEAPLADLLDPAGARAGLHYEGPSWEAADGSKVVRDKSAEVKTAPAPKPGEDIPWLLVKVKPADAAAGRLAPVAYVQRLSTKGGKPPADRPKRAGSKVGVAYTAVYGFFVKEG